MIPFVFQNPSMLLLLLLVPPLWWLLRRAHKRRNAVYTQLNGEAPLQTLWRDRFRLTAVTLLLLALARPGINPKRHSVSKSGRDVVFVLDVSQSMLARDAFPSRLEAAKDGIRDALDSFQSERVGLVIYAGSANILCPLTYDYEFARYMLDQATPRAVDFGGTTLLSATEKCADTMLTDERKGMQDLVVLTDGEEHGPQNARVVELLGQHATGLLMIGIGDAAGGARIPIESEDGSTVYLKNDDQIVTTKLNESGLLELTRMSADASFVSVGTTPFDLAGIYEKYAGDKPVAENAGSDSYVVYTEVGIFLIGVAVGLLLLAEIKFPSFGQMRPMPGQSALLFLLVILAGGWVWAENPPEGSLFVDAMRLQTQGRGAEAIEAYDLFESEPRRLPLSRKQLATLRVNQGVCYLGLASQQGTDLRSELSFVKNAQTCFLEAGRLQPGYDQAVQRLDPTATLIAEIRQRIEEEEEREQALREQLQELVDLLRKLEMEQIALMQSIPTRQRNKRSSRNGQTVPEQTREPDDAVAKSKQFAQQQSKLMETGESIYKTMKNLKEQMTPAGSDHKASPTSFLLEPLRLMRQVVEAQELAVDKVKQWTTWPTGRDQQQLAIARIQEILNLLSNDSSDESEEGEWDDEEEYDEMMESSDSENATMSSIKGQGDFASESGMQPLPTPNYSVEDILQQESGNLQFRQQQRAKGNKGKVENDW